MKSPELTIEQQEALQEQQGFVRGSNYVLMTLETYRRAMGISEDQASADLAATQEGLEDIQAGRTRPAAQVFQDFDEHHWHREELKRRLESADADPDAAIAWEQVRDKLLRRS